MNNKNYKQKLLLEYMISSPDTFALCKGLVKREYFDPEFRNTVEFLHTYYESYSSTPSPQQILAETGLEVQAQEVTRDKIAYCTSEIEQFCRQRAVQNAILAAPKMIADGDYGKVEQMIRDAITISLSRNLGIEYFSSVDERIQAMLREPPRTSTLWPSFDDCIAGGLARKEILLFSANSGGGKSITLANLALNFLCQPKRPDSKERMDVLYLSLELSEEMIAQRFDTMLTGISSVTWRNNYETIIESVDGLAPAMGRLTIKHMPSGTCANDIRAYLKEFELVNKYVPDVLVVDYLDIMGANEHVSADNISEKDKRAAEQLRNILFEYDMYCFTASQQNRSAIDAQELTHAHIAGGITKVNTADWYVSIILNHTMKAAGEIGFAFLKTRSSDGVGKTIYLKWDNNALRIRNPDPAQQDLEMQAITSRAQPQPTTRKSLLDAFDIEME